MVMCGKETETGLNLMEDCTLIWNVSYKLAGNVTELFLQRLLLISSQIFKEGGPGV